MRDANASPPRRVGFRRVLLATNVVLAIAFTLYLLEASFGDEGRILAPGIAIVVPILWIVAALISLRFPRIAVPLYAIAAMLLFFERDGYHGFIIWGWVSLLLATVALWSSLHPGRTGHQRQAQPTREEPSRGKPVPPNAP